VEIPALSWETNTELVISWLAAEVAAGATAALFASTDA